MRPTQVFFTQIEKIRSKARWIIRIVIALGLVVTTAVVATGCNRNDNSNKIIELAVLEIIMWDLFVMPILIGIFTLSNSKLGLKY